MDQYAAVEAAYKNGYQAGVTAAKDALRKSVESFLSDDDIDVIISEGEVFVPINAMRKIIRKLEVK